jgi:hypothetical protein
MSEELARAWVIHYQDSTGKRQEYVCTANSKGHAKYLFEQDVKNYVRIKQIKHKV